MAQPIPIKLTQVDTVDYSGMFRPAEYVVVGSVPSTDAVITPQAAPTVDPAPADAAAVATDLQAVVDALVAAGVFTSA